MHQRGGLAVYVTSHGFGHLNRTAAVLNRIPFELAVTIRCHPDLFEHWNDRLSRPVSLEPYVSDSGASNPRGDSSATDGPATLARAMSVYNRSMAHIQEESDRLRAGGFSAVLSDIPPVPLLAASRAGIPGFALGNFTWSEIYREFAEPGDQETLDFLDELRRAYGSAAAVFRAEPALTMAEFSRRIDVGLVVSPGRDRRHELRSVLGIPDGDRVVYFYVGRYGQDDLDWDRLARIPSTHFVGFHPAPVDRVPNLHVVPTGEWNGADLMASADVAVAKAGYGTVSEAMASGTPLIYPPRRGFAEHAVLDQALRLWGGGIPATFDQFASLELDSLLDRASRLRPGAPPFPTGGASRVAAHLHSICRET